MLRKVEYVYGTFDNKKVLLGAKLFLFDGERIIIDEYYVGFHLTLEDIVENKVNANALGVTNPKMFELQYIAAKAAGVVFFPQTNSYSFLEEGDQVLTWISEDTIESILEAKIDEYRSKPIDNSLMVKFMLKKAEFDGLDGSDPRVELFDSNLVRHHERRVSSR